MDLNEMTVFARVAQTGSFTTAAKALGMPKSTVSRRVSDLEQRLGARLLQRTTRRLSLTDVGQTFYQHCARIVTEVEDAERAVHELQTEPRGTLRITAPVNVDFVEPLISSYLALHPDVRIDLVCVDRVVDLIQEGFDIGIRAGKLDDSSLVARSLGSDRGRLVASPSYLDKRGRPKSPSQLEKHDAVVFGAGRRPGVWSLERDGKTIDLTPRARLVVNEFGVLLGAAIAGLGVALLPENKCASALEDGRLEPVLPRWSSAETPFHAVYPSTRHLSAKVKSFLDFAQANPALPRWRRAARA